MVGHPFKLVGIQLACARAELKGSSGGGSEAFEVAAEQSHRVALFGCRVEAIAPTLYGHEGRGGRRCRSDAVPKLPPGFIETFRQTLGTRIWM